MSPLDGADEDSVISIVKLAVDTFGRLDGMHVNFTNAADAYLPGGVVDLPLEAFDEVMRVNTRGFVICAKHAIPADDRQRRRVDRVHRVDRRLQRRGHPGVLPDEQGRRAGADASHRAQIRPEGHSRQCHCARADLALQVRRESDARRDRRPDAGTADDQVPVRQARRRRRHWARCCSPTTAASSPPRRSASTAE